jgi:hypothetical protein
MIMLPQANVGSLAFVNAEIGNTLFTHALRRAIVGLLYNVDPATVVDKAENDYAR